MVWQQLAFTLWETVAVALRMLTTRVLLTEDRLAQDFQAALERRELPEKFFYWFPTSVRAWLNLCSDGAYRNYVRSHGLVQAHAADIAAHLPQGDVTVVSLGAGQGDKDLLVLEQIRASGRRPHYVPVDASQSLLEMACDAAGAAGLPCQGVKADMADAGHLAAVGDASPGPRLWMMLGNTLGAFDPPAYARARAPAPSGGPPAGRGRDRPLARGPARGDELVLQVRTRDIPCAAGRCRACTGGELRQRG